MVCTVRESITCSATSQVCWPVELPSESQRSPLMETWTQKETTVKSGGSPPSVSHNAPGRWYYRTAAWTEESRTTLIEIYSHNTKNSLSRIVRYSKALDSLHELPLMESWLQPHYIHTGRKNQTQIWVLPVPGLQLVSVGGGQCIK